MKKIITWSIIILAIFALVITMVDWKLDEESRAVLMEDLHETDDYVRFMDIFISKYKDDELIAVSAVNTTFGTYEFASIGPIQGMIGDTYVAANYFMYSAGKWNPEKLDYDVWFSISI